MVRDCYPFARIWRSLILYTVFLAIPCFLASSAPMPSYLGAACISATISGLILVLLLWIPHRTGGFVPRPFRSLSTILSRGVPSQRCAGFVHSGLSHEWQTNIPSGIGPFVISHAKRLAMYAFPFLRMVPYPFFLDAVQGQHSLVPRLSTLLQRTQLKEQFFSLGDFLTKCPPQFKQLKSISVQFLGIGHLVKRVI